MPIAVADKSIHEGVELLGAFVKVRRTEHDAQDDHRIGGMNAQRIQDSRPPGWFLPSHLPCLHGVSPMKITII